MLPGHQAVGPRRICHPISLLLTAKTGKTIGVRPTVVAPWLFSYEEGTTLPPNWARALEKHGGRVSQRHTKATSEIPNCLKKEGKHVASFGVKKLRVCVVLLRVGVVF